MTTNNSSETTPKENEVMSGFCGSLVYYGAQDESMRKVDYNIYSTILQGKGDRYQTKFCNFDTITFTRLGQQRKYLLNNLCIKYGIDLITDIYVEMPRIYFDNLKTIEFEIGGQSIDYFSSPQKQIRMNAELFKKDFEYNDDTVYFPLSLGTFHDNHFLALIALKYHEAVLIFRFNDDTEYGSDDEKQIKLYGKLISADTDTRKKIKDTNLLEYAILGSRYVKQEPTIIARKDGMNTYELKSNCINYPTSCMYMWGFDLTKVKQIEFRLNNKPYFTTDVKTLQRIYGKTNNKDVLVWMIKDTVNSLTDHPYSTLNFSRIDTFSIHLHTTEDINNPIHTTFIYNHIIRYINGMAGLAFSK